LLRVEAIHPPTPLKLKVGDERLALKGKCIPLPISYRREANRKKVGGSEMPQENRVSSDL